MLCFVVGLLFVISVLVAAWVIGCVLRAIFPNLRFDHEETLPSFVPSFLIGISSTVGALFVAISVFALLCLLQDIGCAILKG